MKTVIIGAGPASLMAATQAVKKKGEVIVFEKMKTAGRKFLVAGEGGFNLSHIGELDDFISYYSHAEMANIIRQFTNEDLIHWLEDIGIQTYVGSSGKIFPIKEIKPAMVLTTWLNYLKQNGVVFVFHATLIDFDQNSVTIKTKNECENITFDRLILGLGAASWPKTGSDASWVSLFQSKKVEVIPFQSSNAGCVCNLPSDFLTQFQGSIFKNVIVSHKNNNRKGEVLVTEYGLEGAPIYYLNPSIRNDFSFPIIIDFKPNYQLTEIVDFLKKSKNTTLGLKHLKLPDAFIFWCKTYLNKDDYTDHKVIASHIKHFMVPINRLRPIEEAISCCGGVSWGELDTNLRLKKFPNISVIGEMVDWEAPTGGYLLQGAFSMGFVAGSAI
jgi:hypothetical protein